MEWGLGKGIGKFLSSIIWKWYFSSAFLARSACNSSILSLPTEQSANLRPWSLLRLHSNPHWVSGSPLASSLSVYGGILRYSKHSTTFSTQVSTTTFQRANVVSPLMSVFSFGYCNDFCTDQRTHTFGGISCILIIDNVNMYVGINRK